MTTAPAHGLFGPGIFGTGIDLSALDEDTAWRLGVWMGQQLHDRDSKIRELTAERDRALAEASEAGGELAIATAHAQTLHDDLKRVIGERMQAHKAMAVAEQQLGEALGFNTAEWYPGMPALVESVRDYMSEVNDLRRLDEQHQALRKEVEAIAVRMSRTAAPQELTADLRAALGLETQ